MTDPPQPPHVELAVGAVVERAGQILLIVRGKAPGLGQWSLPGGRVESGESMLAAVEREVFEETGLDSTCGDLIGWVERISPTHHFVILDFRAAVNEATPPTPGDDAADARWVSKADVRNLDLVDGLKDFLVSHNLI